MFTQHSNLRQLAKKKLLDQHYPPLPSSTEALKQMIQELRLQKAELQLENEAIRAPKKTNKSSSEMVQQGVVELNANGDFILITANQAVRDALGDLGIPLELYYGAELKEFCCKNIDLSQEKALELEQVYQSVLKERKDFVTKISYINAEGAQEHIEATVSPIIDQDGTISQFIWSTRNITHTLILDAALKKNKTHYKNLFESSPDATFQINRHTNKVERVNQRAVEWYGYSKEEFATLNIFGVMGGKPDEAEVQQLYEVLDTGSTTSTFRTHRTKSGKQFPVNVRVASLGSDYIVVTVRDITNMKATEEALIDSKDRFKKLFDLSPDLLIKIEASSLSILDANQRALEEYGYTKTELIGMHFHALIEHIPSEEETKQLEKHLFNGEICEYSNLHKRKDKSTFPVHTHFRLIEEDIVVVSSRNISKAKQREIALAKSKENFEKLFNLSPDFIFKIDLEQQTILDVNQSAIDYYGFSQAEFVQKKLADIEQDAPSPEENNHIITKVAQGEVVQYQGVHQRKDGTTFPINVRFKKLLGNETVAAVRDISDMLKREKELQKAKDKLQLFFDLSPDEVFKINCHTLAIEAANRRVTERYGYSQEELLQLTALDLEKESASYQELQQFYEALPIGVIKEGEGVHQTKSGAIFPVHIRIVKISTDRLIASVRDISDIKKISTEIQKTKQTLELAIKGSKAGVWEWKDVNKEDVWWDAQCHYVLGYKNKEITPTLSTFKEIIHPDMVYEVLQALENHLQHNTSYNLEAKLQTKSGKYRWFHLTGVAERENGQPTRMVGSLVDIHERKIAEEKNRTYQKLLEETQQLAKIGSWELDLETQQLHWSKATYQMFNIPIGTAVTYGTFLKQVHPEDREGVHQAWAKAVAEQSTYSIEHRIIVDDQVRWVYEKGRIIDSNGTQTKQAIGLVQDITPIKRAQLEIQNTKETLELALEASNAAVWTRRGKGLEESWHSPNFYKLLGYSASELQQEDFPNYNFVHPADQNRLFEVITNPNSNATSHNFDLEYRLRTKSGSYKWFRGSGLVERKSEEDLFLIGTVIDISEQKKKEALIARQQYLLEQAQEIGKIGSWEIDLKTNKLIWTKETHYVFGIPLDQQVTYELFLSTIHPDDRAMLDTAWQQAVKNQSIYEIEHRIIVDGKTKWLKQKAIIYYDEQSSASHAIGFAQDITDKKQTELALKESEARYRTIFNSIQEGICKLDAAGHILYNNPALSNILGYSLQELEGMNVQKLLHPDYLPSFQQMNFVLKEKGKGGSYAPKATRKDGSTIWLQINSNPIYDESGTFVGSHDTIRDITQRKLTEEALLESKKRFEKLFDTSPDIIFIHNKEVVLQVNQTFLTQLGYPNKQELIGQEILETIIYQDDHSKVKQIWETGHSASSNQRPHIRLQRNDGSTFWAEMFVATLEVSGKEYLQVICRDITERLNSRKALIERESYFRYLFEYSPIPIWEIDFSKLIKKLRTEIQKNNSQSTSLTLEYGPTLINLIDRLTLINNVNQTAVKLFEAQSKPHLIQNFSKLFNEKSVRPLQKQLQDILAGKESGETDFVTQTLKGNPRVVHVKWVAVQEYQGNSGKVYLTSLDITERKKAEIGLKESKEELERLFEVSPDFIFKNRIDNMNIVDVNERACRFYGYSKEEFRELSVTDLQSSGTVSSYVKEKYEQLSVGQVVEVEGIHKKKNGETFPVFVRFCKIDQTHIITVARDTTAQKKSIKEIEDLKHALDATAMVLVVNAEGTITFVNDKFAEISKYSHEETIGKNFQQLYPKASKGNVWDGEVWEDIRQGKIWNGELKGLTKDKQTYWVRTSIIPFLNDEGYPFQYVFIQNDITNQKRQEVELREAKEEADRNAKIKENFLANMSHEIRTPMNGVFGFARLLLQSDIDKQQRSYAESIYNSAENLLTVINDILDISKIESGTYTITHVVFDLAKNINNTLSIFQPAIQKKNLFLELNIDKDINTNLLSDPKRISQLLINLIGNAVKFTQKGGIVVNVQLNKTQTHLLFEVVDTGIGIPKTKVDSIFESFTQVENYQTRGYGGTGLGLAICKKLVGLMDGEIGVSSKEGMGSTFYFTIPYRPQATPQLPPENQNEGTSSTTLDHSIHYRILLVEDHPVNQKLASIYLEFMGCDYDLAHNGEEAVEKALNHQYDAILMDIQMPKMDGLDATKRIRSFNQNTPIIAMTAHALHKEKQKCLDIGMDDYLSKPFKKEDLEAVIQKHCQNPGPKNKIIEPIADIIFESLMDEMGNEEQMVKEILFLFNEEAQKFLSKMALALEDMDIKQMKALRHKIRPSFELLGMSKQINLLYLINHLCHKTPPIDKEKIDLHFEELKQSIMKFTHQLDARLQKI